MRMMSLWMYLIILEVAMLIFTGTAVNSPTLQQPNATALFNVTSNSTSVNSGDTWNFVFDPVNWNNNNFITFLLTGLIVGGAIGMGTFFFFRSDLAILYPLFGLIVGSGTIPIMHFWNLVNSNVTQYACAAGENCAVSSIVSAIICVPLALYWIGSCVEWLSGRPTS